MSLNDRIKDRLGWFHKWLRIQKSTVILDDSLGVGIVLRVELYVVLQVLDKFSSHWVRWELVLLIEIIVVVEGKVLSLSIIGKLMTKEEWELRPLELASKEGELLPKVRELLPKVREEGVLELGKLERIEEGESSTLLALLKTFS